MINKDEQKILSIQAIRAIAALLVVFCHSEQYLSDFLTVHMKEYIGQSFGYFGVDIFFVISGFIMVYINQKNFSNKHAVLPFFWRRFIRILPMYWLMSLAVLIIIIPTGLYSYAMPSTEQELVAAVTNLHYLEKSFLLIPIHDNNFKQMALIIAVAWTLVYEMFFYYSFGLLILFKRKIYLSVLCLLFGSLVILQLMCSRLHILNEAVSFYLQCYGNNIILEFIFGCVIAERYLSGKLLTSLQAVAMLSIAIVMFIMAYHIPSKHFWELRGFAILSIVYHVRAIGFGIPAFLLVYAILSLEANQKIKIPSLLIKLGNASYSIYLAHLAFVLVILMAMLKKLNMYVTIPGDIAVFAAWFICIAFGYLIYKYIEAPLIKFIKIARYKTVTSAIMQSE